MNGRFWKKLYGTKIEPHSKRYIINRSCKQEKARRGLRDTRLAILQALRLADIRDSAPLFRPRNSPQPIIVSVTIAIVIVSSIIIVAPSPVAIFTVIRSLISIGLGDHAQLLADL